MRRAPASLTILCGTIGILLSAPAATQNQRAGGVAVERVNGREAAAREVLVRFRTSVQPAELAGILAGLDPDRVDRIGNAGAFRVRSRGLSAAALAAALRGRRDVVYAEPNFVVRAFTEPADPRFPELWGLRNVGQAVNGGLPGLAGSDIDALAAWGISLGSPAHVVGVVDTGIDYNHPDLAPNMWSAPASFTATIGGSAITCPAGTHGFNAIALSCDPMDDHDHGTHVSGTIGAAGNNGIGVTGVSWTTRLMGLKFLDSRGSGTVADAIHAIEFAIQAKQAFAATGGANVRILSNSWGGSDFSQALEDEINAAAGQDILFVAAAGNNGLSNDILPTYPASHKAPNIIAVAATSNADKRASFSNYGAASVHLGAPGVDILSTTRNNTFQFFSGTSMATPHVSGAAALVLSRCALSTAQLKEALLGSVDPIASLAQSTVTGGRLNVASALQSCIAPPAMPTNLTAVGGDAQVRLSWAAATGATSYRVKRALATGGPYALVAATSKAGQFIDTGLTNGVPYYYVVSAVNMLGESVDSNEASATPRIPADLVVSSFSVPGTAGAGKTIVASVTSKNQGTGASDPSTTRLYLSTDTTVEPTDTLLNGAQQVAALGPGATVTASVSIEIPLGVAPGQYYVLAKADADDVLFENQEGNNTRARLLLVGPDLIVSSFTVPSTATPGSTIVVADTTANQGGGAAPASTTRFYWSTNSSLDAGDAVLGGHAVAALEAGAGAAAQTTVTIPSSLSIGTYYIIAEADATKGVSETQETNNTAPRAVQVGADLIVSALTVPPKSGSGLPVVVSETTTNQGSDAVVATVTRFYLSSNSFWDTGDTLLSGSCDVPPLAPGASSSGSTTVIIPSSTGAGLHYIIAKADADNAVAETQEGNNTVAAAMQIGGDLTISTLSLPSRVGSGAPVMVTDTTTNQGGGDLAASVTQFYLSTNALLDASDTLLSGSRAVPALAGGTGSTGSTTVTIPGGLASGSYYFFAKADATGLVSETQETNNTAVKLVTIGPDLIVSSVGVTSPAAAGSMVRVTETVLNQGGGAAGPSTTRYYLSLNITLDASDVLLVETRPVSALEAGASSSGTTEVMIPAGTQAGSYYILAVADGIGAVNESSETNNAAPRGIQVSN